MSVPSPIETLPRTMTAARIHRFGSPGVIAIEQIALPDPREDQVLVRVSAAGVGSWDGWVRAGKSWLPQPLPLTLGSDIAAIIERVGAAVTGFARGDLVYGVSNARFTGGYAEYTAASAGMIAHMPRNQSPLDAASVPVVAVTARKMLFDRAGAREGQNVFVHGGAGSVGAYAVQIAKQANMHVWASIYGGCTDYVRSLGAENVIDTLASDLKGAARWADVVIDTVGGASQSQLFNVAKPGGVVVSSAAQPDAALAKAKGVRAMAFVVNVNASDLAKVAHLLGRGELKTHVGAVLPLTDARAAHEMLEGSRPHPPGKIVLRVAA